MSGPCFVAGSLMALLLFIFSIWKSKDFMLYFQPREETIMLFVVVPSLSDLVSLPCEEGFPRCSCVAVTVVIERSRL